MNAGQFTVVAHAYRADWSIPVAGYEALLEKNWGYGLWQAQSQLEARLFTVDGHGMPWPTASVLGLAPGWHQIAMTYDGARNTLWIDGTAVASQAISGELAYTAIDAADVPFYAVAIGVNTVDTALSGSSPVAPFTGALADVRLFDHALAGAELHALVHPSSWPGIAELPLP
jgi:hypothetical protein